MLRKQVEYLGPVSEVLFVFFALYPVAFRRNFIRLLGYVSFFVTLRYLYQINADYLNYCPDKDHCLFPEIMIDIGIGVSESSKTYEDLRSYQQWLLLIFLFISAALFHYSSSNPILET